MFTPEAVQDKWKSVSRAVDIRHQIDKHPWLVLGGSVVFGCLAFESLAWATKKTAKPPDPVPKPHPSREDAGHSIGEPPIESVETVATNGTVDESGLKSSLWDELRTVAIGAFIGVAEDVTSRAAIRVRDGLNRMRPSAPISRSDEKGERR